MKICMVVLRHVQLYIKEQTYKYKLCHIHDSTKKKYREKRDVTCILKGIAVDIMLALNHKVYKFNLNQPRLECCQVAFIYISLLTIQIVYISVIGC